MRSPSVHETFCEPDMRNTSQNANHGCDLFNSFSTPVLSLFITETGDCAGCNSRNEPELPLAGRAKPGPRGGILAQEWPGSKEAPLSQGVDLHPGEQSWC